MHPPVAELDPSPHSQGTAGTGRRRRASRTVAGAQQQRPRRSRMARGVTHVVALAVALLVSYSVGQQTPPVSQTDPTPAATTGLSPPRPPTGTPQQAPEAPLKPFSPTSRQNPVLLGSSPRELEAHTFGEASGVVESRQYPGVFWLHPDSGNANALWALRFEGGQLVAFPSGELFRRFDVPSLRNRDWEDIEVDDEGFIWLGDIGNNCQCRGNLAVHKLVEPDPFGGSATVAVEASYPVRWTDGDKDAESLFVLDGAVYVISKEGPRPAVYRLGGLRTDRVNDLVKVAELGATGEVGAIGRPTGADVSRDRSRLAVTTPGHRLFVYETSQTQLRGDDLVRALVGGSPAYEQPYRRDDRWEAVEGVAFIGDTHDVLLASESRRLLVLALR
jgi:hypothetical protein